MVCQEIEEKEIALRYFVGELVPELQDEFEDHLLSCGRCRASLEVLQLVSEGVALRAHEVRAYSRDSRRHTRWSWAAIVAVVVVASSVSVHLYRMSSHKSAGAKLQITHANPPQVVTAPHSGLNFPASGADANDYSVNPPRSNTVPHENASDNLPQNGRNYIDFSLSNSMVGRDEAPHTSVTHTPPRTRKTAPDRGSPADAPVEIDAHVEVIEPSSSKVGPGKDSMVNYLPTVPADDTTAQLFSVKPPPYSFSGNSTPNNSNGDAVGSSGFSPQNAASSDTDSSALAQSLFHDAMLAYVEKRYNDAGALLENAVKQAPGSSEMSFFLGVCRLLNGPVAADAVEPLKMAATDEKSPYRQSAHFYLAKAYLKTGDWALAQREMQIASAIPGPLTAEATSDAAEIADVYPPQGPATAPDRETQTKLLSDEGEKELLRLATIDAPPITTDAIRPGMRGATLAYRAADYKEAGKLLEQLLQQEPAQPDSYFYLGICRLVEGYASGAISVLKTVLSFSDSPWVEPAHYFLAKAYLQQRNLAAAETELNAAASMTGEWTTSAKAALARLQALRSREGR